MRANHHIHTPRWSNCCNNAWKSSIARLLSAFGRTVVCSSKKCVAGAVTDVRSTRGPAYGSRRACLSFRVALAASAQVASKQNHQSTRNVGQWSSLRCSERQDASVISPRSSHHFEPALVAAEGGRERRLQYGVEIQHRKAPVSLRSYSGLLPKQVRRRCGNGRSIYARPAY